MSRRAARELRLDLDHSWTVGDMISDACAGRNAGCCGTILVKTGYGRALAAAADGAVDGVVADLLQAARLIVRLDRPAGAEAPQV